jgi:sulfur relay (sulfurtransferase) DsrF/TusC family protein
MKKREKLEKKKKYIYIYNIINYCCNPSTAHLGVKNHDPLVIPSYMYNNV